MNKKFKILTVLLLTCIVASNVFAVTLSGDFSTLSDVGTLLTKTFKTLRIAAIILAILYVGIMVFKIIKAGDGQRGKVFSDHLTWLIVIFAINLVMFLLPTFLGTGTSDVKVDKNGTAIIIIDSEKDKEAFDTLMESGVLTEREGTSNNMCENAVDTKRQKNISTSIYEGKIGEEL